MGLPSASAACRPRPPLRWRAHLSVPALLLRASESRASDFCRRPAPWDARAGWAAAPHAGRPLPTGSPARMRPAHPGRAGLHGWGWAAAGLYGGDGRPASADRQMDRRKQTPDRAQFLPTAALGLRVSSARTSPPRPPPAPDLSMPSWAASSPLPLLLMSAVCQAFASPAPALMSGQS